MTDVGLIETSDQCAEFRKTEPFRDLPPQHATFGFRTCRAALAGNDKYKREAVTGRVLQEAQQGTMRPRLRHAMQVDPRIDIFPPAGQLRSLAAGQR